MGNRCLPKKMVKRTQVAHKVRVIDRKMWHSTLALEIRRWCSKERDSEQEDIALKMGMKEDIVAARSRGMNKTEQLLKYEL
jgi:hypothetical protein